MNADKASKYLINIADDFRAGNGGEYDKCHAEDLEKIAGLIDDQAQEIDRYGDLESELDATQDDLRDEERKVEELEIEIEELEATIKKLEGPQV